MKNTVKIDIRKNPTQERSKKQVTRILDATVRLLETKGIETLTTNHIAGEAGISIASLYQYFPNKHAVIYALYKECLTQDLNKCTFIEKKYIGRIPPKHFFDKIIFDVLESRFLSDGASLQLSRAMETTPELKELERIHGRQIARRYAGYLVRYGSKWSRKRLANLCLLIHDMNSLVYKRGSDCTPEERKQQLRWQKSIVHFLLDKCLRPVDP